MKQPINQLTDSSKPRDFYRELRCNGCRLLICFEYIFDGWLKFVCSRCGEENIFHFKHREGAKKQQSDIE